MADLILKVGDRKFEFKLADIAKWSKVYAEIQTDEKQIEVISEYSIVVVEIVHRIVYPVPDEITFSTITMCDLWRFAFQYNCPEILKFCENNFAKRAKTLDIKALSELLKYVETKSPLNKTTRTMLEREIVENVNQETIETKMCYYNINPRATGRCCEHRSLCRPHAKCKHDRCCKHKAGHPAAVIVKKRQVFMEFMRHIDTFTPTTRTNILWRKLAA